MLSEDTAPIVIAHRGASGYLPEHTLEAYALAIDMGADYIELDLVATRDGHLVSRHEPNLIDTTDVQTLPQFANRRRRAVIDGVEQTGFFASDFTLTEIKTLRAVQPLAEREQRYNGRFEVPTFDEALALAERKSKQKGRRIGVYPETKHPTYHQRIGLALEDRLVEALERAGCNRSDAAVYVQSFETANLKYLRTRTPVRLVQLLAARDLDRDGSLNFAPPSDRPYDWTVSGGARGYRDTLTPSGLAEIKTYADAIGPWKRCLVSTAAMDENADPANEANRRLLAPSTLAQDAHRAGLLIHPWTFRNEPKRLAADYAANPIAEYLQFYALGVDGVFSDFPDTAAAARAMFNILRDARYTKRLLGERDCGDQK